MLKSEVTLLKNENKKQIESLSEDARSSIDGIVKSMSIFKINSYDGQVIFRDLIGMMQELELRGTDLEHAVDRDLKSFVDEITENGAGPDKIELLLGFLIRLSGTLFLSFALLSAVAYTSLTWKANSIILLLYFGMAVISFITDGLITPLFSTLRGLKKYIPSVISTSMFMVLVSAVFLMNDYAAVSSVDAGAVLLFSGVSYVILSYLNLKNLERLAGGRKNHIADLLSK